MCFHLVIPTLVTFLSPRKGKFNVTDKGDTLEKEYFDSHIVMPHMIVAALLGAGVLAGVARFFTQGHTGIEPWVLMLNIGWATYSLIILLASIAVANESKQIRKSIRIDIAIPTILHYANGASLRTVSRDLSMGGMQVVNPDPALKNEEVEAVELLLNTAAVCIPSRQVFASDESLRMQFDDMPLHKRRELVRVVLARADAWLETPHVQDSLHRSMGGVLRSAGRLWGIFWRARRNKKLARTAAKNAKAEAAA
jgi:cellulose synthase (UDP-forming)